ncbi:MAG TPA: histidine kinase [Thermoanaerobaculia bacterium]|nr:histidine kinase [Thermoanaerobaculia bacterium]
MHPIVSSRDRLVLYFLFVLMIGGLLFGALLLTGTPSVWTALVVTLPPTVVFGFIALSAWYPCRAFPLSSGRLGRLLLVHLAGALAAATVWVLVWRGWLSTIGMANALADRVPVFEFLFLLGAILYLLSVTVHYLILAFEASTDAEQRALRYRILAREAELKAFKAQIDPHFLFNSLNSISALCGSRPLDARAMTQHLSDFLRRTLRLGGMDRVSLQDEIDLVRGYLRIEQVRFGDRLRWSEQVEDQALGASVPPLLLQPLVENAVRHGVASLVEGGEVRLRVGREGEQVRIRVENDCDEEGSSVPGEGIGLDNVRGRLQSLYEERGHLRTEQNGGRFIVELLIPWQDVVPDKEGT